MRIIVTGGAGFIGSHVADALVRQGDEVFVVDNLVTGDAGNVNPEARMINVDIQNKDAVSALWRDVRPAAVCHLAGQMDVRVSTRDPGYDAAVNILGGLNVILASREQGTQRIIYAGSGGTVYGEIPAGAPPAEETLLPNPLSPYGISKHTVEHYLAMYAAWGGPEYVVLRFPNVYGPRQSPHGEAGVIAIFAGRLQQGLPLFVFGDGRQTRDYVYVGDLVEAHLLALRAGTVQGVFNVASGVETSVLDLIDLLREVTGIAPVVIHQPARAGEVQRVVMSNKRILEALDWRARTSLVTGMSQTWDWIRMKVGHA